MTDRHTGPEGQQGLPRRQRLRGGALLVVVIISWGVTLIIGGAAELYESDVLSGVTYISGGVATIGFGVMCIDLVVAPPSVDYGLLGAAVTIIGIASIGLGVAGIVIGIAALLEGDVLAGVAGIDVGVACIGVGVAGPAQCR